MSMALASERLLALLVREIAAFEAAVAELEDEIPDTDDAAGDGEAGGAAADDAPGAPASGETAAGRKRRSAGGVAGARRKAAKAISHGSSAMTAAVRRMSPKERIEHIGQMGRVLDKLLEMRRLERLAEAGGPQDDAEAARLGAELLSQLRGLDARRRRGELLFGPALMPETAGEPGGGAQDAPTDAADKMEAAGDEPAAAGAARAADPAGGGR
jgi:hypothetical protein